MAPEPTEPEEQARALCEVLNAHGVRYVVFGSTAGLLQGVPLPTRDVDVVPDSDHENLSRLAQALNSLDPRWRIAETGAGLPIDGPLEPRHFESPETLAVGLVTRLGYVDVVLRPRGFETGYQELAAHARHLDMDGVTLSVASLDDLVASKTLLGREKDTLHLELLREHQARAGLEPTPDTTVDPGLDLGDDLGPE